MVNKEMKFLDNGDIRYEIVDEAARSNIQQINTTLDNKANVSDLTALDTRVTALESGSGDGGLTNMVNGSADGSVRGINTSSEDSSYTMGIYAFAEGLDAKATGSASHAECSNTQATGDYSHSEGARTQATGIASHAEGYGTIAQGHCQHTLGSYNIVQGSGDQHVDSDYVVIIGNGSDGARSNAFAMKWDGTFVFANGTEITPAQFTSLYNINNKIPLTGNETEGQVLIIDKNGNPKWDNKIPTVTNDSTDDYKNKVDSLWEDYQDAITALG